MDFFDHGLILLLASLRERPRALDESSCASSIMIHFQSFASNLVGNVLTVVPQVCTSAHQGQLQIHPYAYVASDCPPPPLLHWVHPWVISYNHHGNSTSSMANAAQLLVRAGALRGLGTFFIDFVLDDFSGVEWIGYVLEQGPRLCIGA